VESHLRKLKFLRVLYGPQLKSSIEIDREAVTVRQLRPEVARGYGAPTRLRAVTVRHPSSTTAKSDDGLRCVRLQEVTVRQFGFAHSTYRRTNRSSGGN
jgi:hypothetical protein